MKKLDPLANAMMAAIMGVSNMGQDHFFKEGPGPGWGKYTTDKLVEDYRHYKTQPIRYTPRQYCASMVDRIAGHLFETDEHQKWFHQEAWSWITTLKKMTPDKIKSTWPHYAAYVDALLSI